MTNTESTQGRPWTVIGTFPTFEAAASRAEIERSIRGQQVKVKQISSGFTVRTRTELRLAVEKSIDSPSQQSASKPAKMKAKDRRAAQRNNTSEE